MRDNDFELPEPRVRRERGRRSGTRRGHRFSRRLGLPGWGYRARPDRPFLQRSVVKIAYVKNVAGRSWAAHGRYLEREGAQREGERGIGFDAEHEERPLAATVRGWQEADDALVWKLVVSPEQGPRMDLRQHTRDLMEGVSSEFGTPLEWVAIEHQNTDNPHVHVLMRGRHADGTVLEIDPDFIKHGFRSLSRDLATRELGYRTEREHREALTREVGALRRTSLDAALVHKADAEGRFRVPFVPPADARLAERRRLELGRLQHLRDLGLARKEGAFTWRLEAGFESLLRELQQAGDIQKRVARHQPFMKQPVTELRRFVPGRDHVASGRLIGTGLEHDLYGRSYLLLEAKDGVVYYAPQTKRVRDARGAGRLRLGSGVVLESVPMESRDGKARFSLAVRRADHPSLPELARFDEERAAIQFRSLYGQLLQQAETGAARHVLSSGWLESIRTLSELDAPERHTMDDLDRFVTPTGASVRTVYPREGRTHRGRLVGYAAGATAERLAVVDNGREYLAFETKNAEVAAGAQVRASAVRDRNRLVWRIDDLEQLQSRERGRGGGR